MKDWRKVAVEKGRVCPECGQPVSIRQWTEMNRLTKTTRSCWLCQYAHWSIPLNHAGGSSRRDNQDREGLDRIRGKG
jgi:hypothetical protein